MDQQAECGRRIIKVWRLRPLASLKPSLNVFSKKSDLLQSNFLWRYQIGSFRPDINAHLAIRQESVSRQGIQSKTALKGFPVERKRHVGHTWFAEYIPSNPYPKQRTLSPSCLPSDHVPTTHLSCLISSIPISLLLPLACSLLCGTRRLA
jgi:hypothetical protein